MELTFAYRQKPWCWTVNHNVVVPFKHYRITCSRSFSLRAQWSAPNSFHCLVTCSPWARRGKWNCALAVKVDIYIIPTWECSQYDSLSDYLGSSSTACLVGGLSYIQTISVEGCNSHVTVCVCILWVFVGLGNAWTRGLLRAQQTCECVV